MSGLLARWWSPAPAVEAARWVVLDVESTGLDPERDALIAIAAVAVHRRDGGPPALAPGDSFAARLRHLALDSAAADAQLRNNVLVHGIGWGEQRRGDDPAEVLRAFARWVDGAPLLGFHVAFDRSLLQRAARLSAPDAMLAGPWIDIEALGAVTHPGAQRGALDDWLGRFGITCALRHDAAADTMATAELLLRLWPKLAVEIGAKRVARGTVAALMKLEAARRWAG